MFRYAYGVSGNGGTLLKLGLKLSFKRMEVFPFFIRKCVGRQKCTVPIANVGAQNASFDHILRPRAKLQANGFEMV